MNEVWRQLRPFLGTLAMLSFFINLLVLEPAVFMMQVFAQEPVQFQQAFIVFRNPYKTAVHPVSEIDSHNRLPFFLTHQPHIPQQGAGSIDIGKGHAVIPGGFNPADKLLGVNGTVPQAKAGVKVQHG